MMIHCLRYPAVLSPGYIQVSGSKNTLSYVPHFRSSTNPFTDREDLLTVRELARLQGFPDDFIFYQSLATQYQDVWTAVPPIIGRLIGKTILTVIQRARRAKIGQRPAKRPRPETSG